MVEAFQPSTLMLVHNLAASTVLPTRSPLSALAKGHDTILRRLHQRASIIYIVEADLQTYAGYPIDSEDLALAGRVVVITHYLGRYVCMWYVCVGSMAY